MRKLRLSLVMLACASLVSCVSLFGVQYDETLENGLTEYNKSAAAFLKSAELSKIRFGSKAANDFYSLSAGTLANLQLRADVAGGSRDCPIASVAALASAATEQAIASANAQVGGGEILPANDASGSCLSIVVRGVRLAQANLEADHKEYVVLSSFVAGLHETEIQASVRVAVQTVRAWRP